MRASIVFDYEGKIHFPSNNMATDQPFLVQYEIQPCEVNVQYTARTGIELVLSIFESLQIQWWRIERKVSEKMNIVHHVAEVPQ